MADRIEVTTTDGEVVGCCIGDQFTNPIRGISGVVTGYGDNNSVRLTLNDGRTFDVPADNFLYDWE